MIEAAKIPGLAELIWKGIKNSKAGKIVIGDFSEAMQNEIILLWEKIKPVFIVQDESLVDDLEDEPEDSDVQATLRYKLKRYSKDDKAFSKMLSESFDDIVSKAKNTGDQQVLKIIGNENITVAGNEGSTVTIHVNKDQKK